MSVKSLLGLDSVSVDGVTITGNGTPEDPLVGSASGGSPGGLGTNLQYRVDSSTFGGLADSQIDATNGYLGLGASPLARLDYVAKDTNIADPSGASTSLSLESLISAPSDSPSLIYGPQSAGGGSGSENPGYSGYNNNDNVDAYIYAYRNIAGILWTGSQTYLGNIGLSNNPSGIDWNWGSAVNGDGSGVDGYVINIINNTMGTNYSYDVGNTSSYADTNIGGTATYQDFGSLGAYTASGQSFNFEPYNVAISPSGFGAYGSSSGGDFSVSDGYNNGSQFWVQHNLSGNSGTGWSRVFLLDTVAGNSVETADTTFYQRGYGGGPGALPYSQHYGFLSDGSTLNQNFSTYGLETSPSDYFSSGHSDSSISDPNNGQYYTIYFGISSIGGGNSTRILRQDGYHYDTVTYPFIYDAFGPNFLIGNIVTPVGLTNPAIIAQNSASLYSESPALKIISTSGAATAAFYDNSTERFRMGYDPAAGGVYIKNTSNNFSFRDTNNNTLAGINTGSVVFNSPSTSSWSFLVKTANQNPFLSIFGNTDSMSVGGIANTSSWLNLAAGNSSKGQLNFATQATPPSSVSGGAMFFNGSYLSLDNSSYRARILQTGTASILSSGVFPVVDASGNLRDSSLSVLGGFGGTVIMSSLQFEAKQGITVDSSKDVSIGSSGTITLSTGANIVGNTSSGSKIGTATGQKFSFWNATPIIQPANTVAINDVLVNTGLRASGGISGFSTTIKPRTGGTAAGSEPMQFTSASLLTTPTAGTEEFLADKRYITISTSTARKEYTLNDSALTPGQVPIITTNGRLTDGGATSTELSYLSGVTSGIQAQLNGSDKAIFDHFVDANNTGTGETDLYSDTIGAGKLATNGDKIYSDYGGVFSGAVSATQQLRAYFGGTLIFDSGSLAIGVATPSWDLCITIIRVSASVVRCAASITTSSAALASSAQYTEVTGLTLANIQILKVTGTAGGVAGASSQITAKLGAVSYQGHA